MYVLRLFLSLIGIYNNPTLFILQYFFQNFRINTDFSLEIWYNVVEGCGSMYDNKYIVGLDIGISSVGWALLALDENDNPYRIIDVGSRIDTKISGD